MTIYCDLAIVPQEGDDDFEAYSGTLAERKKQLEE